MSDSRKKEKEKEKKRDKLKNLGIPIGKEKRKKKRALGPISDLELTDRKEIFFETLPRIHRTTTPNVPDNVRQKDPQPHVRDCFDLFLNDWKIGSFKNRAKYGLGLVQGATSEVPKVFKLHFDSVEEDQPKTRNYTFENEKEAMKEIQSTSIIPDLLTPPDYSLDALLKTLDPNRFNMIELGSINSLRKSDTRPVPSPLEEGTDFRIKLDIREFKMEVEDLDHFSGTAAIYHINPDRLSQSKGRISELFHFSVTDPGRWGPALLHRPGPPSPESLSLQAIFSIDHPSPEMYLIFRIEKVLWGEIGHATDFYLREKLKPKEFSKLWTEGQECAKRLGKYTQSFVCTALQLFPPDDTTVGKELPRELILTNLIRLDGGDMSDHEIYAEIRTLLKKDKTFLSGLRRSKLMPGSLKIALQHFKNRVVPGTVNPVLIPLMAEEEAEPCSSPSTPPSTLSSPRFFSSSSSSFFSAANRVVREIQDFPPTPSVRPHLSYVDHFYVYPECIHFSSISGTKARNISVSIQLKSSDVDDSPPGLPFMSGTAVMPNLVTEIRTSVLYHQSRPRWFEEIRITIPPDLNKKHHLFFTFYHITCKAKHARKNDRGEPVVEDVVGYSWLPLLDDESMIRADGEYDLPVASSVPSNYLSAERADVQWYDKGKDLFNLRTKLVSSITPRDVTLSRYFVQYNQCAANGDWTQIISFVKNLRNVDYPFIVQFFPTIATQLLRIVYYQSDEIALECLHTLAYLLKAVSSTGHPADVVVPDDYRHPVLTSYVGTIFEIPKNEGKQQEAKDCFTVRLVHLWLFLLMSVFTDDENIFIRYLWFVFELGIKARIQRLHNKDLIPYEHKCSLLFGAPLQEETNVEKAIESEIINFTLGLVGVGVLESLNGVEELPNAAEHIGVHMIQQLAYFVKDLLPLLKIRTASNIVSRFSERIDAKKPNSPFTLLKFLFLRIVYDHENFVELNWPPKTAEVNPQPENTISDLTEKHLLIGFLVKEILKIIRDTVTVVKSNARRTALTLLIDLLYKHSRDDRFQEETIQRRIFNMYFVYLYGLLEDERQSNSLINSISNKIDQTDLQLILLSFFFVIRKMGTSYMREWTKKEGKGILKFFQILWTGLETFNPDSDGSCDFMFSSLRPPKESEVDRRVKDVTQMYPTIDLVKSQSQVAVPLSQQPVGVMATNSSLVVKGTLRKFKKEINTITNRTQRSPLALHLQREIGLIILEFLWFLMGDFKDKIHLICKFLDFLLQQRQSEELLERIFELVVHCICKYKVELFKDKTPYCGDLTFQLMRHCNFHSKKVRSEAATILYLFFKQCWEATGHLVRMKMQCSVAVAKLVNNVRARGSRRISSSLKSITEFADKDKSTTTEFKSQLDDLFNKRLTRILQNIGLLRKWSPDREVYADVLFDISTSWKDSPDIKFHCIEALAARHESDGEYEEAAQCRIHLAALVIAHIQALKPELMPSVKLENIRESIRKSLVRAAPNCHIELVVQCSRETALAEGMCCSEQFTRQGFEDVLTKAVESLEECKLFETSIELCRLLSIAVFRRRDWKSITELYGRAAILASDVVDSDRTQSRLFSNYYRVNLFGSPFEQYDGDTFIYKEQGHIRLPDLAARLKSQFGELFGESNVIQLQNAWNGDPSELEKKKAYFQLIAVLPYFSQEELQKRPSPFERATNLWQFIVESPYSADINKKLSEVGTRELGKIKTIYTTVQPFPFVLKRIKVIKKEVIKLTPIETNIEAMKERTQKLHLEADAEFPNPKTLQIVLQGSVLLQVNAGPTEICRVFCKRGANEKEEEDKTYAQKVEELREVFREFLVACQKAVQTNAAIIKSDQKEFHTELENGLARVKKEVEEILDS